MKLLVFASTPPPFHGQSRMVQTLVEGLTTAAPDLAVVHINPRLSRNAADIGRWRFGKLPALLGACARALAARIRHGPMLFYYVPAPGKRAALYRDWLVLLLCRPFFRGLVLHWHAVGLGAWLATHATPPERWLTHTLLGRASLAIVLAPELADDAQRLSPRRLAVVANGVADPLAPAIEPSRRAHFPSPAASTPRTEILFLGLGSREKGLFATLAAVAIAHQRAPGCFRLTVAGDFARAADAADFRAQATALGADVVRHVGFATGAHKSALLSAADVLCFPTAYAHEGQPLVLLEALAHDLPIVTTRWRAIPGLLPADPHIQFVDPGRPDQLAAAFLARRERPASDGALRAHFLAHFTRGQHLAALAAALRSLPPP